VHKAAALSQTGYEGWGVFVDRLGLGVFRAGADLVDEGLGFLILGFRVPCVEFKFYGRGTARAEDAQGTPTQSHISPSILVYEDYLVDHVVSVHPHPARRWIRHLRERETESV